MKIFIGSDHHFFHKNIIKYAQRPFDITDDNCVIDNAKMMLERHNEVVQDDDFVLMIGDLSAGLRGRETVLLALLKLLKGKKILIRGNHDYQPDEFYKDAGFIDVVDSMSIDEFFICHYPCCLSKWSSKPEKENIKKLQDAHKIIIHGHVHNKNPDEWEPDGYKRINACVDYTPNNFYPQEIKSVKILHYLQKNYPI